MKPLSRNYKVAGLLALLTVITACSNGSDSNDSGFMDVEQEAPAPAGTAVSAEVRYTDYGIPHVSAADWRSLGYGHGYSYAAENYCVLMREIVVSNGQSQRYFGDEGSLAKDFVFALLGDDIQTALIDQMDASSLELVEGYVAGFNRYLADTGAANLPEGEEGCRDAPWVRDITLEDAAKMLRKLLVRASTDPLADFIYASSGPTPEADAAMYSVQRGHHNQSNRPKKPLPLDRKAIAEGIAAIELPKPEQLGSNAYAVGSEATQNGRGALFGNPHFPWSGSNRFTMVHLTMTPEGADEPVYDVMGGALHGVPLVNIGFSKDIAWSHTVSTASRFVLYELRLNPDNPMQYEVDGEMRDITERSITIDTMSDSGTVEQQSHTFYFSEFGPIVDLGSVNGLLAGWPIAAGTGTIYSVLDINSENIRGLETWRNMGAATSIAELETAVANIGIPWVNTIAADRAGTAFYGDISAVPNLTEAQKEACITGLVAPLLTDFGLTTLDASNPDCALGTDADAPVADVIGYDRLPKLINTSYAANANDSYWLANPNSLLSGFPSIIGDENVEQSMRTRLTFVQMEERLNGTDGLGAPGVTPTLLQDMLFGSRNLPAEMIIDDVRTMCSATPDWSAYSSNPAAVAQACGVLAGWDTRHNIDSVGGHVFYEFWREVRGLDGLWQVEFDPADPVNTPNTLNTADADVLAALRQGLADGTQTLLDNNIALDAAWGDVQFSERNGERIPIHGGSNTMLFSVITSELVPDEGYSNIVHGNSYMQTVGWDDSECPDAYALLSYSQSTNPDSDHYADQTMLYSNKQWVDMPFCEADITAAQDGEATLLEATLP